MHAIFEDIFRQAPFDPALTLPGGDSTVAATHPVHKSGGTAHLDASTLANGRDYLNRMRAAPDIFGVLHRRGGPTGSNQWAVGGAHTPSGRAMLASDAHQPLDNPGLWHQTHLSAPDMDVIGDDVAGAPESAGEQAAIASPAARRSDLFIDEVSNLIV